MANTPIEIRETGLFGGARDYADYLVNLGRSAQRNSAEPCIKTIDGYPYLYDRENNEMIPVGHNQPVLVDDPTPAPYEFFTLEGFADYISENVEGLIPECGSSLKLIVHVIDETHVALMSQPSERHAKRFCIAKCAAHAPSFPWERYMDVDTFNTMLLSKFVETEARASLFKVVKSMTKEQNCNTSDDGVSQVITVTQGVSMAANVQFQNPVPLKPMRTFSEIDQPESNFTLRVDNDARAALFEADGGAWKVEAVKRIRKYLEERLYDCNVVVLA